MSNIWFTSDTHYHHKNIVRGTTEWDLSRKESPSHLSVRDFDTLNHHDDTLVNNINKYVQQNDILWHLGDWSFGGEDRIKEFRERLICKNINLVFGNHDHHIENLNKEYKNLFNSVQYYKELKINKNLFILSHYAFRVWNKSHKGSIHLYGHSHGSLPDAGNRSMDIGMDTNNLFPYNIGEIIDILTKREIHSIDHHNIYTNE